MYTAGRRDARSSLRPGASPFLRASILRTLSEMRPELSAFEGLAMTTTPHPDSDRRSALRTQWLQRAADAFDRMFGSDEQDLLVSFDQREQRACLLGDDLALWLLQQHLNEDSLAGPSLTQTPPCPK